MGLDMYLEGKFYFGGRFNEDKDIIELKRKVLWEKEEVIYRINTQLIESITLSLCYWRKVNAIHKWFVDNCFEGEYDEYKGEDIDVSISQLKKLKDICKDVLDLLSEAKDYKTKKDIIDRLLPMQDGFFFGFDDSEEGIEYYIEDIKETIPKLDNALKVIEQYNLGYAVYCASW